MESVPSRPLPCWALILAASARPGASLPPLPLLSAPSPWTHQGGQLTPDKSGEEGSEEGAEQEVTSHPPRLPLHPSRKQESLLLTLKVPVRSKESLSAACGCGDQRGDASPPPSQPLPSPPPPTWYQLPRGALRLCGLLRLRLVRFAK